MTGAAAHGDRRERLLFGALSVVVLLGAGVITAIVVEDSGRAAPEPARPFVARSTTTTTEPAPEPSPCRTPVTPDDPLRLWIGGDSLAGSLGPALGERAAATGVVAPVYDSRSGSGLSTPDFFDWPEHAVPEMERLDPEVVVFIMGTNDFRVPSAAAGTTTSTTAEPEWRRDYAERVAEMLTIFHGTTDRYVVWVGAPPLRDEGADAGVREVNAVIREVVQGDERAAYFDEYALFASEDGEYTATLPRPGKRDAQVRSDDGVHFTDVGAVYLGDSVYQFLDERCRLDDQAVDGVTQPVVRVPGSSERVEQPTEDPDPVPTTAPPTTAPPTTTTGGIPLTVPPVVGSGAS